ncbi:hypothetical protein BU25DRAFT_196421 [Macroventuria anomochaeta]|uniref:Uncharacterized protein n=1 Tax=Macroventuria anomochaeta TaxID=301207 RepID=A0ACB6SE51_9PLEO|nr:uncharacterized protein BU25DRAFT_196421 [Macroventuria anomochaeta]KAF2631767.1 hypothetical protein BU25DRAFT_196421 [Macroventuria anomochaeta]
MASPQESITTVNGRRCTRSRARTAATSTSASTPAAAPTVVAPTEPTTSTIAEQPPQTQQTAASPPASQPLPPPVSSSPVEQSAVVPLPTSQAAVSSAAGTGNAVLISLATTPLPAVLGSSVLAPEASTPNTSLQSSEPVLVSSQAAAAPPARIAPKSSDTIETAVIGSPSSSSLSSTTPPIAQPAVTESAGVANPTSVAAVPDILETVSSSQAPSPTTSIAELLSQTSSATLGNPTRGPVGIIAPEQGSHSGGDGHNGEGYSSHSGSDTNIGGVVGGVVGGFVGLALLSALLFFCLRRRKSREGGWNEKSEESSGFMSKVRAVPAGFGVFFARLRNEKAGPLDNPYQRHQPRSSVGSVYSTTSSGRGRSISEPQGQSAVGGGFVRRMSSRKSERNVLRKKTSSVSSQSPFMRTPEASVSSNNVGRDLFADPAPDMSRNLRISNPDTTEQQPRGPSPPQPAATPRVARGPFASLINEIDGAPDWLRDSNMTASSISNHRRTQSTASALQSHPPSSVYSRDPFADSSPIPPIPTQSTTAQQPQPPLNTYSAFSATRDSNYTFFGEPGPSRPGTNMFTPSLPSNPSASRPGTNLFSTAAITPGFPTSGLPTSTSRMDRQSDPFDLDRPEVLSFKGIMNQMRDSIARQTTTRSRRTSSVGNWFGRDGSPSGALNGASVRR